MCSFGGQDFIQSRTGQVDSHGSPDICLTVAVRHADEISGFLAARVCPSGCHFYFRSLAQSAKVETRRVESELYRAALMQVLCNQKVSQACQARAGVMIPVGRRDGRFDVG